MILYLVRVNLFFREAALVTWQACGTLWGDHFFTYDSGAEKRFYSESGTKAEYIHIMDTILVICEIFAPSFERGGTIF